MRVTPIALLCLGCASAVSPTGSDPDGGPSRVDRPSGRDVTDARADIPYFDAGPGYDVFREDACPGARPPPMRAYECDPFAQRGCPAGEGCYVFIEYPAARCGSETYRAQCFSAGSTSQGRFCQSGSECAPGHGCFVTGAMNRCLRLCRIDGSGDPCPRGAVCEPTDLPDFGACQ